MKGAANGAWAPKKSLISTFLNCTLDISRKLHVLDTQSQLKQLWSYLNFFLKMHFPSKKYAYNTRFFILEYHHCDPVF